MVWLYSGFSTQVRQERGISLVVSCQGKVSTVPTAESQRSLCPPALVLQLPPVPDSRRPGCSVRVPKHRRKEACSLQTDIPSDSRQQVLTLSAGWVPASPPGSGEPRLLTPVFRSSFTGRRV